MSRNGKNNKGGRPKGSLASHTLEIQEAKKWFIQKVHENIEPIFMALLSKAATGDVGAARELIDRAWGKPLQSMDMTTKGESVNMTVSDKDMQVIKDFEKRLNKNDDSSQS